MERIASQARALAEAADGAAAEGAAAVDTAAAPSAAFRREGEFWTLRFDGAGVRMKDSKGLADLAVLLARPGREVHVFELLGSEAVGVNGDAGEMIDRRAIGEYRRRLTELADDIAEAEAANDDERAEGAQSEHDALVAELSRSLGLGGRARRTDDPVERARKAVLTRVRNTMKRVEAAHPPLGAHLRQSVRTGTFCRYDPPELVLWDLG